MLTVSGLYIYPIKSLGGIAVESVMVTSRGLQHDRRLVLTDASNRFLTQREHPVMALLQPVITHEGLYVGHKKNMLEPLFIPSMPEGNETAMVTIWDDVCEGRMHDASINEWFSKALDMPCKLFYMPETTRREVEKPYAHNNEITSFADAYPILIIGQSSLDDLNKRMDQPLPMNRFRPNIVFTGGDAFLEDEMQAFTINGIAFFGVKPCARCVLTTINQDDASKSKEPLKTLATYRQKGHKILFGQNLLHKGDGIIHIGDEIQVSSYQPAAI